MSSCLRIELFAKVMRLQGVNIDEDGMSDDVLDTLESCGTDSDDRQDLDDIEDGSEDEGASSSGCAGEGLHPCE